jgi:hypothetical protein
MKRNSILWFAAAGTLACSLPAWAQTSGSAASGSQGTATAGPASAGAVMAVTANADADLAKQIQAVRANAAQVSGRVQQKAEARLRAISRSIDEVASRLGETQVAARMATEFGLSSVTARNEVEATGTTWGDWTIAHTLDASAGGNLDASDLLAMHEEGLGWGEISAGLMLDPSQAASAVQAELDVASGLARADGRVATIGSAPGFGSASLGVTGGAGAAAGGAAAGVGVSSATSASVSVPVVRIGR